MRWSSRDVINGYLAALDDQKPRSIRTPSTALADYVVLPQRRARNGRRRRRRDRIALFSQGRLVAIALVRNASEAGHAHYFRSSANSGGSLLGGDDALPLVVNGPRRPRPARQTGLIEMAKGRLATGDAEFAPATPAILPAVGAALGAVREGVVRLNLLPTEQREAFDEGPSMATWVLLALSALLLVTWGAMAMVKDGMLRRDVQSRLAAMQPDVNEVMGLQEEIDHLQRQVEILGQQDGRVTTLLKELTELIPSDAYLTTLNLRGGATLTAGARSASDIITALREVQALQNVTFSSPTTRQGGRFASP